MFYFLTPIQSDRLKLQKRDNSMCNISDPLGDGIERNLLKALGRLTTGLVNIPIRAIERRDAEKLAETEARIAITESLSKQISEQVGVSEEYVKIAGAKFAERIVREQNTLDKIVNKVTNNLQDTQQNETNNDHQTEDISDDWLNQFREVACKKNSEDAQNLFSKVLEGEIRNPGSFSLRSLTTLADMDQKVATLFNTFCSLSIVMLEDPNAFLQSPSNFKIRDVRVPIIRGSITDVATLQNRPNRRNPHTGQSAKISMSMYEKFGLGLNEFQLLSEYGLILDATYSNYPSFWYNNEIWVPMEPASTPPYKNENFQEITISGFCLTTVGKELFHITKRENPPEYLENLTEFLQEYYDVKIVRCIKQ